MDAAVLSGDICPDVAPYELLRVIGNLAVTSGDDRPAHTKRRLMLLLAGLCQEAKG